MSNQEDLDLSHLDQRKLDEIEFHNRIRLVTDDPHVADTRWSTLLEGTVCKNPLWENMKYYSVERRSREYVLNWLRLHCENSRVLDLCCGNGADSIFIARECNAKVVGCDLSNVSIDNCRVLAGREGVADQVRFDLQDAEKMSYPDNSFDIVTEYGALHHVDLPKVYAEMARVLRPGGRAICNETLGHNLVINWYRKLTPHLRTAYEVNHILKKPQIELAKKYFREVHISHYHLFTLAAVPFRKTSIFEALLTFLESVDEILLKLPVIQWQAWQAVIELHNPIKKENHDRDGEVR
jgi:ubiquinone/menaquinone biosynthesis C-methylase UbiE